MIPPGKTCRLHRLLIRYNIEGGNLNSFFMDGFNKKSNDSHGGDNLLQLIIVVNGTPYKININQNEKVAALIREALRVSASSGRKEEDWRLKYNGQSLQPEQKIKDYGIPSGAELFLSLAAGQGG
jgi:hypothetical protein